jgi:hypothetical protein
MGLGNRESRLNDLGSASEGGTTAGQQQARLSGLATTTHGRVSSMGFLGLGNVGIDHLIEDVRWIVKAFERPDAQAGIPK